MGSSYDRTGDSASERPSSEITRRRSRQQAQRDFEIDFLERVLERDPCFVDALRVQGNNLASRGEYARTLLLDRRLVHLVPGDAIAWYNLSCTYAVLGMTDPAFSALQRVLELGYRFVARLRQDPDLKTLRRDPRFLRLLRRFEFIV